MTLTEFLLARIAEDEVLAEQIEANPERPKGPECVPGVGRVAVFGRSYLLAECEAKREIITECRRAIEREDAAGSGGASVLWGVCVNILRHMTLPYADHPDCRDEWRP